MSLSLMTNQSEPIDVEVLGFSGGERHVQLKNLPAMAPSKISVRAYINSSDDLMDLLLVNNALTNHYGKQVLLNLEIPYLPYARQDRVCAPGQAFSLELMANLLSMLQTSKVSVWDCHSSVGTALTGAVNIPASSIIQQSPALLKELKSATSVLVCPDKGAVPRCEELRDSLGLSQMVMCEKKRNPETGQITKTEVLVNDLSGKTAVITDDICDGGFTFIKIAEQLKEKKAKRIVLFVTHGIFSKGLGVFDGLIDHIYTSNSFPQSDNPRLSVIDFQSE